MKKAFLYALFGIAIFSFAPAAPARAAVQLTIGTTTQPDAVSAAPNTTIALTRFTLTNSGTDAAAITGLSIRQAGTASDTTIAALLAWDESIAVIGSKTGTSTFDSTHTSQLPISSFSVPAGQSRTLMLGVAMASNISADAGKTVALSVVAVQTSATIGGPLPVIGIQATIPAPVGARPQCNMSTSPSSIVKGGSVTLKWSSINATSGNIPGPSLGDVPPSGQANLIPLGSTRYEGTFTGTGGVAHCETSVTVSLTDGGPGLPLLNADDPLYGGDLKNLPAPDKFSAPGNLDQTPSLGPPPAIQAAPQTQLSGQAGTGLVPCSGLDCQACHLATLAQKIINFLIGLSIPLAAAMFAYAGVIYFTSGVVDKIEKAHKIFTSVLIGFALAAGGWLIVQTILSTILSTSYKNWNEIRCIDEKVREKTRTASINDLLGTISVLNRLDTSAQPAVTPKQQLTYSPASGCATGSTWDGTIQGCVNADGEVTQPVGRANAIAQGAEDYYGKDTSAGPDGGNKACAWAVNNVLRNEGIPPIDGDSVENMERELNNGRGTPSGSNTDLANTSAGDIVVWKTDSMSHVGICEYDGCASVLSNSSSGRTFSTRTDAGFNKGVPSRIYHVNN